VTKPEAAAWWQGLMIINGASYEDKELTGYDPRDLFMTNYPERMSSNG
jgi:hypothetical protein